MIDLSKLTAYVDEQRLPLIRKSVLDARTINHISLQTGVKSATALNILDTNVTFGDGASCGWNEDGTSTLSQRQIVPASLKVNMSFCDKKMQKYWMQNEVNVAAGRSTLPFEEEFIGGIIDDIRSKLDGIIWNGITINGTKYNGLLDIAGEEGVISAEAGSTVYGTVKNVYMSIPASSLDKTKIFVGMDTFRSLVMELTEKNLFHYDEKVNDSFTCILPGTMTEVVGVEGLNGKNKVVALNTKHTFYGTDLESDYETFDLWYSKDNQEFRVAINFIAGVQVAYLNEVVVATLQ